MFNNQIISGSSGQGGGSFYSTTINQSLRFHEGNLSYLTFTPAQNGTGHGDNKKYTFSLWIKLAQGSADFRTVFSSKNAGAGTGQGHNTYAFGIDDDFELYTQNGGANPTSPRLYRDPSAWYHFCLVYDTTQSTDTDRVKVYVNGTQQTDYTGTFPSLNSIMSSVNTNGQEQRWGRYVSGYTRYFNGYMAEIHMVDGQALAPTNFAEEVDGAWSPKEYANNGTTSHGINGYHLTFEGTGTGTTSQGTTAQTNIGDDQSGNGNNFAVSGFDSGDVVKDSPTNSFCVLNPLTAGTYPTLSEGNLKIASVYSADLCGVTSTWFPTTGKWYWEIHSEGSTLTYPYFGISDQRRILTNSTKGSFYSVAWLRTGGSAAATGTNTYMGTITKNNVTSWTNNDIIMFALDVDARKLWIGKNGTWDGSGDPAAGSGEDASWTVDTGVSPVMMGYSGQGLNSVFNFGQDGTFAGNQTAQGNADENGVGDFYYSPPTGFLAMATSNIAESAISAESTTQSDDNFNTLLYTGTGNTGLEVNGLNFQPNFLWIKRRDSSQNFSNALLNSVTGPTKGMYSNRADGEFTSTGTNDLQSFDSDGFTIGPSNQFSGNDNGGTFVAWSWKAGGTPSGDNSAAANAEPTAGSAKIDGSNQSGAFSGSPSIAIKRLSANTTAGISIVKWTGTGSAGTIPHGLGAVPHFYVVKNLTDGSTSWMAYHRGIASDAETDYIYLNDSADADDSDDWNDTAPTANVFSVKSHNQVNASGDDYIAYLFTSIEGYSKIAHFAGTGLSNGPFVFTGFRPTWIMYKQSSAAGDWNIIDDKRQLFNDTSGNPVLRANLAGGEEDTNTMQGQLDILSNGFKLRSSNSSGNTANANIIYIAFGDAFKFATAR